MIHRLLTKAANAILNGREQSSCSLRRNTSPHTTEYAIWRCGLYCGDALNINANKQTRTLGIVKRGTDCREAEEQVTFVPSPNILKSHFKKKMYTYMYMHLKRFNEQMKRVTEWMRSDYFLICEFLWTIRTPTVCAPATRQTAGTSTLFTVDLFVRRCCRPSLASKTSGALCRG